MGERFQLTGEMWRHPSAAAWHFLTIPEIASAEIRVRFGMMSRGFGSLRVEVTIGDTRWRTSIFYDRTMNGYLLPVKAAVRKAAGLTDGDQVQFVVQVL
ncbi:MAG: DUF1905 domain-containing protein [Trueperaceae bacterium]